MKLAPALFPLALTGLTALPAQQPFKVSDYLPNDYRCMMRADLEAMRDQGIWDDPESGILKMMIGSMEREAGFPLASLDRVMLIATFAPDAPPRQDPHRLVVLEGNAPLDRRNDPNYTSEKIGGHDVMVHAQSSWLYFQPRPEVRIEGVRAALEPVLAGQAQRRRAVRGHPFAAVDAQAQPDRVRVRPDRSGAARRVARRRPRRPRRSSETHSVGSRLQ